jgi:3',5'-cyclic AMP phosphodiesterase CpdA
MFVLAHLSDPHLAPLPTPRFSELASKRMLGFLNWQRRRRNIHRADTLAALVADLKAQSPDHIAVTGDLVNISLADEFAAACAWLSQLGPPADVSVVAGNHDAYVRAMADMPRQAWGDWMRGDRDRLQPEFPYIRRRGPVALVGLSSAVPTRPLVAAGRLGPEQIERMTNELARLGSEDAFRVVLIHHPPTDDAVHRHERLMDAESLRTAIGNVGAELVLHGHAHVRTVAWLDGPRQRVPAVGVPSASAAPGGHWEAAGYNLYRIEGGPGGWRCEAVTRAFVPETGMIAEVERRTLVGD